MHVRDFVFENNIYVKYITLINYRIWLINENSDRHELIWPGYEIGVPIYYLYNRFQAIIYLLYSFLQLIIYHSMFMKYRWKHIYIVFVF